MAWSTVNTMHFYAYVCIAPLTSALQQFKYGRSRRGNEFLGLVGSRSSQEGGRAKGDRHEEVLSYTLSAHTPRILECPAGAFGLYRPRAARHRHRSCRHLPDRPPGFAGAALK